MCGIIGVSGIPEAARLTYLGLYALQHRGQESAGIVAVDRDGTARAHRGMGLVSENFDEAILSRLPGDVAVGHTRYSTTGSTVLANAQPCSVNTRCGTLAIAHNGNLTNAAEIKRDLVEKGANLNVKTKAGQTALDIASNIAPSVRFGPGKPPLRSIETMRRRCFINAAPTRISSARATASGSSALPMKRSTRSFPTGSFA